MRGLCTFEWRLPCRHQDGGGAAVDYAAGVRSRGVKKIVKAVLSFLLGPETGAASKRGEARASKKGHAAIGRLGRWRAGWRMWADRYGDIVGGAISLYVVSLIFAALIAWASFRADSGRCARMGQGAECVLDVESFRQWLTSPYVTDRDPGGVLAVIAAIAVPLFLAVQFQDWRTSTEETATVLDVTTSMTLLGCAVAAWGTTPASLTTYRAPAYAVVSLGLPLLCGTLAFILQRPDPVLQDARDANEEAIRRAETYRNRSRGQEVPSLSDQTSGPGQREEGPSAVDEQPAWGAYARRSLLCSLAITLLLLAYVVGTHVVRGAELGLIWRRLGVVVFVTGSWLLLDLFYSSFVASVRIGRAVFGIGEAVSRAILPLMVLAAFAASVVYVWVFSGWAGMFVGIWLLGPAILAGARANRAEMEEIVLKGVTRVADRAVRRNEKIAKEQDRRAQP